MEEQIIELLNQTRSGESINSAEEQLTSLSESPEFLPSLTSIYSNAEIPEITRYSALLYMHYAVYNYWKNISEEVQNLIKSSLPEIIINWPNSKKKSMYHFAHLVVNSTITKDSIDWPELPDIILQYLSEGNENSWKIGLVLSNSLCGSIKQINKANQVIHEWAVNFGMNLLQILMALFSQCEDYEFLSLGFHCASRILRSNADFDFFSFAENLLPIVEKSFLISNFTDHEDYYYFSYKALKFSIQYLTRYITIVPISLLAQYLQIIQQLLPLDIPARMKCDLLKLMNEIFKNPESWSFICENLIDFLANLILPLYALTPDNIASFNNNPEEFVNDVDKSENNNFEDIRLSASQVILTIYEGKGNPEDEIPCSSQVVDACRLIAGEMYTNYISQEYESLESQIALFSSFHMFSIVSKNMNYDVDPQLLTKFFSEIFQLFDSEDALVRSAAFKLLSKSTNVQAPIELTLKSIEHIIDDFPVARYYAIIAASGLVEKFKDKKEIQSNFEDPSIIQQIFSSIFELCQQFHFSDIASAISILIDVFDSKQILPIAMNIFSSLMEFLSASSDSIETMKNIITDSLEKLVELISKNEEAINELAPTFCEECLNVLQNIESNEIFDLLLSVTKEIIDLMHFDSSMWAAADMLIDRIKNDKTISLTEPIELISSFIIKDDEFETRDLMPTIVSFCIDQMKEKMDDFDSWSVFASLASNLLMRLRENPIQQGLVVPLTEMLISQIETNHQFILSLVDITILANSLLMTNYEAVSQILGEKFPVLIEFWINNPMLPHSLMTFAICFNYLSSDSDILLKAMISVTNCLFPDILEMDSDEFNDYVKTFPWVDFSGSLIEFTNQLSSISSEKSDLYSQFLNEVSDYQDNIPEIPNYVSEFKKE